MVTEVGRLHLPHHRTSMLLSRGLPDVGRTAGTLTAAALSLTAGESDDNPAGAIAMVEGVGDADGVDVGEVGVGERDIAGNRRSADSIDDDPPCPRENLLCTVPHVTGPTHGGGQ
jgi:hypothetical protein